MSPEDEARARLLAHYERVASETAQRAQRLRDTLCVTDDRDEADLLRLRIEQLSASSDEARRKAESMRALIERARYP